MIRSRVSLDVDGVLCDFHERCLGLVNTLMGKQWTKDHIVEWDLFRSLKIEPDVEKLIYQLMATPGWCEQLDVYPGAQEGVAKLQEIADVYVCTSPMDNPHWVFERTRWLKKHFGIDRTRIAHTSAKHIVSADYFVDDRTSTLREWLECHPGGHAIRWWAASAEHTTFNEGPTMKRWDDLYHFVRTTTVLFPPVRTWRNV